MKWVVDICISSSTSGSNDCGHGGITIAKTSRVRDGTLKPADLVSRCRKVFCLPGAGLTLGAYLFHFWVISLFSLDIPFWDEWDVFPLPLEVGSEAILNWLFLPHNQHWIVPTR